ncbi:MAG: SDR family oxidoreductase [Aeromicrobium sp.]
MTLEQQRVPVADLMSVAGTRVVITGGLSGIGLAIAEGLAAHGARVAVIDLPGEQVDAAADDPASVFATVVGADVSDETSVESAFDACAAELGGIDVVFANAGVAGSVGPLTEWTLDQWRAVQGVNLDGAFLTARAALRRMDLEPGKKLIFTASVWGQRGSMSAPCPGYSASKAGVIGLMKQLSADLSEHRVSVNAIAPSGFLTNIAGGSMHDPDAARPMLQRQPRHTFVSADAAVGTAVYLASAASDHVTGHVLALDGGYLGV